MMHSKLIHVEHKEICTDATKVGCFWTQVRIARWYEQTFGRKAHTHLCVSKAMQQYLGKEWDIKAEVFYDTPPEWFRRAPLEQAHDLLQRLGPAVLQQAAPLPSPCIQQQLPQVSMTSASQPLYELRHQPRKMMLQQQGQREQQTRAPACQAQSLQSVGWLKAGNPFTEFESGVFGKSIDRPALVVSSTSWTVDEDFGILLEAGTLYDAEV